MFYNLSSFHAFLTSSQPFFIDPSNDLFPLSNPPSTPEPNHPPPDSNHSNTIDPPSIAESDPPHIPELDQVALVSAIPDPTSVSTTEIEYAPITTRRSTRVREIPHHPQDYHVFSTIMSLVEPTSYHEASTNPL